VRLFGLPVDHDLDVMVAGQTPIQVAAAVLTRIERTLRSEQPDWVVVQGDTTSAAATALAAFYGGHRVVHVEAGLRTGMRRNPFPEEINRRVVSPLADLHCAPTAGARDALLAEGVPARDILVTGNTVVDALMWACDQPPTARLRELAPASPVSTTSGPALRIAGHPYHADPRLIVVTAHRRENFGRPLEHICTAIGQIADRFGSRVRIVFPVHPNPSVTKTVHRLLGEKESIQLVEPLDYVTQAQLMARAWLILTDSGGIQEEAPSLRVPVLVLRQSTERPEAAACGAAAVVGTDAVRIVSQVSRLWDDEDAWQQMRPWSNPFGDGHAAARILQALAGETVLPYREPAIEMTATRAASR
jgi:UDP-N-acetylglucosamine 2-epimerase (non-hydrolysing)